MQQRGISTDILKSVKINKSAYGEEFHEAFGVTWAAIIISVVSTFYKFTPIYLSAIDKRIFLAAAFLFSPFIFLILFTHDCHPLLFIFCFSASRVFGWSSIVAAILRLLSLVPALHLAPVNLLLLVRRLAFLSASGSADVPLSDALRPLLTSERWLSANFYFFQLNISNFRWILQAARRAGFYVEKCSLANNLQM